MSCIAHILTWEAADNRVKRPVGVWVQGRHVVVARNARPVLGENATAVRFLFALGDDLEPGPFQAKVKPADSREE